MGSTLISQATGLQTSDKPSAGSVIRSMICADPSVTLEKIKDQLIKKGYGDKYKMSSLQIAYNETNALIRELRKHYKLVPINGKEEKSNGNGSKGKGNVVVRKQLPEPPAEVNLEQGQTN